MVIKNTDDVFDLVDQRAEVMTDLSSEELASTVKEFLLLYSGVSRAEELKQAYKDSDDDKDRAILKACFGMTTTLLNATVRDIDRRTGHMGDEEAE